MCWLDFFFFKQKTAYEMRISDWSSDVCSSDLRETPARPPARHRSAVRSLRSPDGGRAQRAAGGRRAAGQGHGCGLHGDDGQAAARSEEHTSELQSLMRISYAVFCLKKKTSYIAHKRSPKKHTT